MMLTLTIKEEDKKEFDIQVPSAQRISDTLQVLSENRFINNNQCDFCQVYSARQGRLLDVKQTYEENGVYTADIIAITYEEEKRDER